MIADIAQPRIVKSADHAKRLLSMLDPTMPLVQAPLLESA